MTNTLCLYGPPGTGKSRTLVRLFLASARVSGPEKVGAITFTRAGAEELRSRLAAELGLHGTQSYLKKRLPYVGTIHSLCFRRLGCGHGQMVTKQKLVEFCLDARLDIPPDYERDGYTPDELDDPLPVDEPGFRSREIDLLVWADAAARHRGWPFEKGLALLGRDRMERIHTHTGRMLHLKRQYDAWKEREGLLDYQDLLQEGLKLTLPVHTLLVDEVQDNSPLLFAVADAWGTAPGVVNYALAGDPYQAIYKFAGGDPELFLRHQGRWLTIGNSHRLSPEAADYAKRILGKAGWEDPKLDTWEGVGGRPQDGTTLYLARTNALMYELFVDPLIDKGVPFRQFRGRAPLETNAGLSYKFLHRLANGLESPGVDVLARALKQSLLPPAKREHLRNLKLSVSRSQLEALFERPLPELMARLPYAEYFNRVLERYGRRGLYLTPRVAVSTIHGAKGREADLVVLARSWAHRPYMDAALDPKPESLVAYVACTRHRAELRLLDGGEGKAYRFPDDEDPDDFELGDDEWEDMDDFRSYRYRQHD